MREVTERPEAIEVGAAKLVGTHPDKIVQETLQLLKDQASYDRMTNVQNPFGDDYTAGRIVEALTVKCSAMNYGLRVTRGGVSRCQQHKRPGL